MCTHQLHYPLFFLFDFTLSPHRAFLSIPFHSIQFLPPLPSLLSFLLSCPLNHCLHLYHTSLTLLLFSSSTILPYSLSVFLSFFSFFLSFYSLNLFHTLLCHVKSVNFTCPFLWQPVYHNPRHTCNAFFLSNILWYCLYCLLLCCAMLCSFFYRFHTSLFPSSHIVTFLLTFLFPFLLNIPFQRPHFLLSFLHIYSMSLFILLSLYHSLSFFSSEFLY